MSHDLDLILTLLFELIKHCLKAVFGSHTKQKIRPMCRFDGEIIIIIEDIVDAYTR